MVERKALVNTGRCVLDVCVLCAVRVEDLPRCEHFLDGGDKCEGCFRASLGRMRQEPDSYVENCEYLCGPSALCLSDGKKNAHTK